MNNRTRHNRRGAMLVMVLVCMFVVATLSFSLVSSAVQHHRRSLRHQHELQAMWLAESAVDRAAARLRRSDEYTGETWQLPAEVFDGRHAGVARIRVEKPAGDESARTLIVEADFPDDPTHRARYTKRVTIELAEVKPAGGTP